MSRQNSPITPAMHLEPGLRMVLAPNPSPMTAAGTCTYILGTGEVAVIDPGPNDPRHLAAIEAALAPGERITHVLVTHSHLDHSRLATPLARRAGARTFGFGDHHAGRSAVMAALAGSGIGGGEGVDTDFQPNVLLADEEVLSGKSWQLRALHTPGHMANHLCFEWLGQGALFTGDHVMGWSSTLVSPPDGDMGQFMASLERLQTRKDRRYYPAHGDPVDDPAALVAAQLAHRRDREAQILAALKGGLSRVTDIRALVYTELNPTLHRMAERNILAHLIALLDAGRVATIGPLTADAEFALSKTLT